ANGAWQRARRRRKPQKQRLAQKVRARLTLRHQQLSVDANYRAAFAAREYEQLRRTFGTDSAPDELHLYDACWTSHTNGCECGEVLSGAYQLYERLSDSECGIAIDTHVTIEEAFAGFEHILAHRKRDWSRWRLRNLGERPRPVRVLRSASFSFAAMRFE